MKSNKDYDENNDENNDDLRIDNMMECSNKKLIDINVFNDELDEIILYYNEIDQRLSIIRVSDILCDNLKILHYLSYIHDDEHIVDLSNTIYDHICSNIRKIDNLSKPFYENLNPDIIYDRIARTINSFYV